MDFTSLTVTLDSHFKIKFSVHIWCHLLSYLFCISDGCYILFYFPTLTEWCDSSEVFIQKQCIFWNRIFFCFLILFVYLFWTEFQHFSSTKTLCGRNLPNLIHLGTHILHKSGPIVMVQCPSDLNLAWFFSWEHLLFMTFDPDYSYKKSHVICYETVGDFPEIWDGANLCSEAWIPANINILKWSCKFMWSIGYILYVCVLIYIYIYIGVGF